MFYQVSIVNSTKGYRFYESSPTHTENYESLELGEIYKQCVSEYGRCTGKVYIDTDNGTKACGWVFVKRVKYDDCKDTYLQETWVHLISERPVVKRDTVFI